MKIASFIKEVKIEASKIYWPSGKEALMACALVIVVSIIASLFFFLVDSIVYKIIQLVLGIRG